MAKLCVHCGTDCTDLKRFKDAQRRYTCAKCHDRLKYGLPIEKHVSIEPDAPIPLSDVQSAPGDPTECPRCKGIIPAGETVCPACRYDTTIGAAPMSPAMQIARPCPKCGYDMRGLKDAASCPECGADIYEREHVARAKKASSQSAMNYYLQALQIAGGGMGVLVITRFLSGHGSFLLVDGLSLLVSVPCALVAYWLFSVLWAGGFDQAWGLAAANFLAVFAVTAAVDAVARWILPLPIFVWPLVFFTFFGLLMSLFDLDRWWDALVLSVLLLLIQWVLVLAIAAML